MTTSAHLAPSNLTSGDVERYRRDGYLVLKGQIPPAAIQACLDELLSIFNAMARERGVSEAAAADLASLTGVMTALFAADMAAYLAAAKLAQHTVALHRLGLDEAVLGPIRAIGLRQPVISTRPVLFMIHDRLKVPGGYHKSPAHQDWRSIQGSLDSVVTWIPFLPTGPGAHALEVLPGSHALGLAPSADDAFGHRIDDKALPPGEFVPLQVGLGDAVLFSCFLIHRTGRSGGPVARLAASYRYNNVLEPTFARRAYPNPYLYRPDMTVITPDFPDAAQLAAVFGAPPKAAAQ